jgi:predicted transcriptional regulator
MIAPQIQTGTAQQTATVYYSDTQATAIDLYERGLNVIPLRRHSKIGFILRPFFTARLHHCGAACNHPGRDDITDLFARRNIGIMTGRTSGNLLAIDCDSPAAFDVIGKELTARAIPFWAITGSRGGAYLLRLIEGEAASITGRKSHIKDVEIWGNRRLIVMPPSIHPSGIVYQWATPEPRFSLPQRETIPAVSIKALDWLGVQLLTETRKAWKEPELFGLPQWAALLSYKNRETFTSAVPVGQRNAVLTAFTYDMAGNGIDYHEAERVTLDYAGRVGLKRREALDTLKSAYSQDREPARRNGGGQPRAWQRAKAFAESFDWRGEFGRRALKAQAVFMACVERARRDGREVWRASVREVAELANCNKETVADYMHLITEHGLIERTNKRPQDRRNTGLYRFAYASKFRTLETPCSYSVRNLDTPNSQAEQDIFGAIGLVSWHVWKHLHNTTEASAAAISRRLGLPRSSTCAAIKRLTGLGLIARGGDGQYYAEAKTEASLQYLAAQMFDGASRSQARKTAHRIERERAVNRAVRNAIDYHEAAA